MDDIENWEQGVIAGTVAWGVFSIFFYLLFALLPPGVGDGPFTVKMAYYWVLVGKILGVGDIAAFISILAGGSSRGF